MDAGETTPAVQTASQVAKVNLGVVRQMPRRVRLHNHGPRLALVWSAQSVPDGTSHDAAHHTAFKVSWHLRVPRPRRVFLIPDPESGQ